MNKIPTFVISFMLTIFFTISTTQFNTASAKSLVKQTSVKKKIRKSHRRFRLAGCHNLSRHKLNLKAKRFNRNIRHISKKYNVSSSLIKAVITTESCFRPSARGSAGEKGLMQLMSATGRRFNIKNRYNPRQNIQGGTRYLSYLLKRYGGSKRHAVAAYNAGEGRIRKNGYIPNKAYVYKVMSAYRKFNGSRPLKSERYTRTKHKSQYRKRGYKRYTIKSGDSLSRISHRFRISSKKLIRINHLKYPYRLKAGKRIYLKKPSRKYYARLKKNEGRYQRKNKSSRKGINQQNKKRLRKHRSRKLINRKRIRYSSHKSRKTSNKRRYYRVRSGDTLYSVMRKKHVSVKRLIRLNHLKKPYILRVKKKLRIK